LADIIKLGRKGELALPRAVRAALNLKEGDEMTVSVEDEAVVLRKRARRFGAYLERLTGGRERS
jgi:AbrB family looped-hinge helix DNA binding protein